MILRESMILTDLA